MENINNNEIGNLIFQSLNKSTGINKVYKSEPIQDYETLKFSCFQIIDNTNKNFYNLEYKLNEEKENIKITVSNTKNLQQVEDYITLEDIAEHLKFIDKIHDLIQKLNNKKS